MPFFSLRLVPLVPFVFLGCTQATTVEREDCEQLRDHVVDLRLSTISDLPTEDMAGHRSALRNALGEPFVSSCMKTFTPDQIQCAKSALDSDAASSCLAPKSK